MVLLDQNAIVQAAAVVVAPAHAYGILLQGTVARRRLARIQHPRGRADDALRGPPAHGRHAGQAAQKVQGGALPDQHGPRRPLNPRDNAPVAPRALLRQGEHLHGRVDSPEDALHDRQAAQHALLLLADLGDGPGPRRRRGLGGQVAAAHILG